MPVWKAQNIAFCLCRVRNVDGP